MSNCAFNGNKKVEPFDDRSCIGEVPEAVPNMLHCHTGIGIKNEAISLQVIPYDIRDLEQWKKCLLAAGSFVVVSMPWIAGPKYSNLTLMGITLQPFAP
jgi:hypothetical protein